MFVLRKKRWWSSPSYILGKNTMKYLDRFQRTFAYQKYDNAWRLDWNIIKQWINKKRLHLSHGKNLIDVYDYIRDLPWSWNFTWSTGNKRSLRLMPTAEKKHLIYKLDNKPFSADKSSLSTAMFSYLHHADSSVALKIQLFTSKVIRFETCIHLSSITSWKVWLEMKMVIIRQNVTRLKILKSSLSTLFHSSWNLQLALTTSNRMLMAIVLFSLNIREAGAWYSVLHFSSHNVQIGSRKGLKYTMFCDRKTLELLFTQSELYFWCCRSYPTASNRTILDTYRAIWTETDRTWLFTRMLAINHAFSRRHSNA